MKRIDAWIGAAGRYCVSNPGAVGAVLMVLLFLLVMPKAHAFEVRAGNAPSVGPAAAVSTGAPLPAIAPTLGPLVPFVKEVSVSLPVAPGPVVSPIAGGAEKSGAMVLQAAQAQAAETRRLWPTYASRGAARLLPCVGLVNTWSDTCVHDR